MSDNLIWIYQLILSVVFISGFIIIIENNLILNKLSIINFRLNNLSFMINNSYKTNNLMNLNKIEKDQQ